MAAALAADQRSLQPILDSNPGAAGNRSEAQKEHKTILNTPKTDALYERLLDENPGNLIYLEEMLHHARQMERERDEAREFLKASSKGISKTVRLNQFLLSELIAVRKERDDIKEVASEFAMTASHCLGWHENQNPNQITSALARWLKISSNELDA